jgi:hypothetical protein
MVAKDEKVSCNDSSPMIISCQQLRRINMATEKLRVRISDAYDSSKNDIFVDIMVDELGIYIRPHGYGEKTAENGHGFPIMIEQHDGAPRVIVWSNINKEEPTHFVDIGGAKESNRVEESQENNAPND